MNKNDLIEKIAEKADLSKTDVNKTVDALIDVISEVLKAGDEVGLPGFGGFKVSQRAARTGRHPQTGQPMKIPASKSVKFKVSKKLKDLVNT